MRRVSFVAQDPLPDVTVKACRALDQSCADPLDTATTDASGHMLLTVPVGFRGFDGYLDLSGGTVFPALHYYVTPPVIEDALFPEQASPERAEAGILADVISVTLDPKKGQLIVVVYDCLGAPAPGVRVDVASADDGSTPFYLAANGFPDSALVETSATTSIGGALNLPPHVTTLTTTVVASGARHASMTVIVRPDTLTLVELSPTPASR